ECYFAAVSEPLRNWQRVVPGPAERLAWQAARTRPTPRCSLARRTLRGTFRMDACLKQRRLPHACTRGLRFRFFEPGVCVENPRILTALAASDLHRDA